MRTHQRNNNTHFIWQTLRIKDIKFISNCKVKVYKIKKRNERLLQLGVLEEVFIVEVRFKLNLEGRAELALKEKKYKIILSRGNNRGQNTYGRCFV